MQNNIFGIVRAGISMILALGFLIGARNSAASVALLMEEPYGTLGAFDPAGHAAIYLNHVCAASPTRLRACEGAEVGVVVSQYHHIHGNEWIAMPLVPYLYAVERADEVPSSVDKTDVLQLRSVYWEQHLTILVPPSKTGGPPKGNWDQLVGASYDRKIHGFEIETTREQDERFITIFNDRRNVDHYNFFAHNCADFSRTVLNIYWGCPR